VGGQLCLHRAAAGAEAKEVGLERHPGGGMSVGGVVVVVVYTMVLLLLCK
jgi:hypothetical protein